MLYNRGMYERSVFIIATALLVSGCTVAQEAPIVDDNIVVAERATLQELFPVEEASPSEPFEPWSETFSRRSLGIAVMNTMKDYFGTNYTSDCDWSPELYTHEPIADAGAITTVMNETVDIFCEQLSDDPLVIISPYFDVAEVLEERDRPTDDHGRICGGPSSGGSTACALYHNSWVSPNVTGENRLMTVAHEMFHNVQDSVNKGMPSWRKPWGHRLYVPMWFLEGAAVTYQASILHYLNMGEGRYFEYQISSAMLRTSPDTAIDLASLERGGNLDTYVVGHFATEYIVASVGFEPLLNIVTRVGENLTFSEALQEETGMSVEEFYNKMSKIQLLAD